MRDADALALVLLAVAAGALIFRDRWQPVAVEESTAPGLTLDDWLRFGWVPDGRPLDAPVLELESMDIYDGTAPAVDLDAMRSAPNIVGEFFQPVSALVSEFNWFGGSAVQNTTQQELNIRAFLDMIAYAEVGTTGPEGYSILYGGGRFESFGDHPRRVIGARLGGKMIYSSAAGRYQIMQKTWDWVRPKLGLPDFSPASQDAAAVWLLKYRGALEHVKAGRFEQAVNAVRNEWASMPAAPYGQPTKRLADLQQIYASAGGAFAGGSMA